MKKKCFLWLGAFLLMLAGCSSDETGEASDLMGYWKVIDQEDQEQSENRNPNAMGGLCFKKNGEIIEWGKTSTNWYETYTGKWWVSDEGELLVDVYEGSMCHIYTGIKRLSKTHLVIRSWGGFAGTSREDGHDTEYTKLDRAPNYDNLSKYEW